jgi:hypothetical protein
MLLVRKGGNYEKPYLKGEISENDSQSSITILRWWGVTTP